MALKQNTWTNLNMKLHTIEDEKVLQQMINEEMRGECRSQFVLRIHSKLNKIRGQRERQELIDKCFRTKCHKGGLQ